MAGMLLRNYDNVMFATKVPFIADTFLHIGTSENFGDGYLSVKDKDGNIRKLALDEDRYDRFTSVPLRRFLNVASGYGQKTRTIRCGSGTTPVTYDDYMLESEFTADQTTFVGAESTNENYNAESDCLTRTITYKCFVVSDITIGEIGIYDSVYYSVSSATTTGADCSCLMYREVLAEPIQVSANSTYTVSLTITVRGLNPNNPNKETTEVASSVSVE